MSDIDRPVEPEDIELERRLELLERPSGGDMLQPALPVGDIAWLIVAVTVVSVVLLWWAL